MLFCVDMGVIYKRKNLTDVADFYLFQKIANQKYIPLNKSASSLTE